ncbi:MULTISPECIES: hypothetical protein [Sphingobacterium]|uniref:hypothetical protein n=1 Tax=Sphingobacterium TaxID=28453 RepID=UPI0025797556|nr:MULTISPECIES: hypothetical protein [Sphingobacterium]
MLEITEIQRHLNIDKELLLKHCPQLKNILINEVITCLDYKNLNTNEQYRFNNFEPFDEILQQKIDTLFYMVFLKAQHEYRDSFLFGMTDIVPKEDFNDNEKSLLKNKIFFLKHAKQFHLRLLALMQWRNTELKDVSVTLTKKRNFGDEIPDIHIENYALERGIIDNEIYRTIDLYLNSPYANAQYYGGKIDNIKVESIHERILVLDDAINYNEAFLATLKNISSDINNKKKSKSTTERRKTDRSFNAFRGESATLVFNGYIYKCVQEFFDVEQLTFANSTRKSEDNLRYRKLVTYEILARLGLISTAILNNHDTIAKKETYISTLPFWNF